MCVVESSLSLRKEKEKEKEKGKGSTACNQRQTDNPILITGSDFLNLTLPFLHIDFFCPFFFCIMVLYLSITFHLRPLITFLFRCYRFIFATKNYLITRILINTDNYTGIKQSIKHKCL